MSRFAYEPNERLYPAWQFVLCERCGKESVLVSNPQKVCVMCRIAERTSQRKWPDDFKGFGSNVQPRKQQ
jgi:ribosomal protein L37E